MAIYTTLRYGSSGSEVSRMQQALTDKGYDVGYMGVDGKYGKYTRAAVLRYQQDNGLAVDGIAGDQTLGKLYALAGSGTGGGEQTPPKNTSYDPNSDAAYQTALEALNKTSQKAPAYSGTYDGKLNELYQQIVGRSKFTYDLDSDMLYQQYKDQYINLGQQAMEDSMGQAAHLTGGYGSTYAEAVGQQQYNAYLQQLNDRIPELYGLALDRYNAEGTRLQNQYSMAASMAGDEYSKYMDAYNRYLADRGYYQDLADKQYDRGHQKWADAYNIQQDAFNRLYTLIGATGYFPTDGELAAAGMTRAAANALRAAYYK